MLIYARAMRPFERWLTLIGSSGGALLAVYGLFVGSPWWFLGLLVFLFGGYALWAARHKKKA